MWIISFSIEIWWMNQRVLLTMRNQIICASFINLFMVLNKLQELNMRSWKDVCYNGDSQTPAQINFCFLKEPNYLWYNSHICWWYPNYRTNNTELENFIVEFSTIFALKNLRTLSYFLKIEVLYDVIVSTYLRTNIKGIYCARLKWLIAKALKHLWVRDWNCRNKLTLVTILNIQQIKKTLLEECNI